MAASKLSHKSNVRHIAGEVGGMGAHHRLRLRPQQPLKVSVVQLSVPVRPDEVHRRALAAQAVEGPQHGVVLAVSGQHMVTGGEQTADGDVQGLGGVAGEHHPLRSGAAQQPGQLLTGAVDDP